MKIVKLFGGLGNQMFQYALAVALKAEFPNEKILLDTSAFKEEKAHNGFELFGVFKVSIRDVASVWQILMLTVYSASHYRQCLYRKFLPKRRTEIIEKKCFQYYDNVFRPGSFYYDGFWQSPDYFDKYRDLVLKEFKLNSSLDSRNQNLLSKLLNDRCSVSLHVRRGDYLKSSLYEGTCPLEYYIDAVRKARQIVGTPINIYVFSDDIQWAKTNLREVVDDSDSITFVCWNALKDSYKDMKLMSACRVNIIANSSFSWWAAYLNSRVDKHVFAPKYWINDTMDSPIHCKGWTLV